MLLKETHRGKWYTYRETIISTKRAYLHVCEFYAVPLNTSHIHTKRQEALGNFSHCYPFGVLFIEIVLLFEPFEESITHSFSWHATTRIIITNWCKMCPFQVKKLIISHWTQRTAAWWPDLWEIGELVYKLIIINLPEAPI